MLVVTSPALKHFLAKGDGTTGALAFTNFWSLEASLEESLTGEESGANLAAIEVGRF